MYLILLIPFSDNYIRIFSPRSLTRQLPTTPKGDNLEKLLFDEKEKHYMLIHQKERIIDFLNHELELD